MIQVVGGKDQEETLAMHNPPDNPRPIWTKRVLSMMKDSGMKRVRLCDPGKAVEVGPCNKDGSFKTSIQPEKAPKRQRRGRHPNEPAAHVDDVPKEVGATVDCDQGEAEGQDQAVTVIHGEAATTTPVVTEGQDPTDLALVDHPPNHTEEIQGEAAVTAALDPDPGEQEDAHDQPPAVTVLLPPDP